MKGKWRDFPPSSQGKGNMPSRDQKWSLGRPGTCGGSWDPGAGQGSGGGGWDLGLGLDRGGPGLGGGGGWDLWRRRLGSVAAAVGICGGGGWDLARGQDCVAAAAVGGPGGQGGSGSRHIDCPCSVPGAAGRNCKSSVTAPPPITKYNYHVVVLTCRVKRVNGYPSPYGGEMPICG